MPDSGQEASIILVIKTPCSFRLISISRLVNVLNPSTRCTEKKTGQLPRFFIQQLLANFPLSFSLHILLSQTDFSVFGFVATFAAVQYHTIWKISCENFCFLLVFRQNHIHRKVFIGRINQLNIGCIENLHTFIAHRGPSLTCRRHTAVGIFLTTNRLLCSLLLSCLLCGDIRFRRSRGRISRLRFVTATTGSKQTSCGN